MWNQEERLSRLSELSERACDLRLLAAKIEPMAEELDEAAQFSKYDWTTEGKEDDAREKTEQLVSNSSEMSGTVDELRELAGRIEALTQDARALVGGRTISTARASRANS